MVDKMGLLKEIRFEEDFNLQRERIGARGLFFDETGMMPLQFVQRHNIHKFPGGGVRDGEDIIEGLKRELIEETGCDIEVTQEVGKIIEYRAEFGLKQTSHCYIGKILSKGKPLSLTKKEINQGVRLMWVDFSEALRLIESDEPETYNGRFIHERELVFAKKAKELLDR